MDATPPAALTPNAHQAAPGVPVALGVPAGHQGDGQATDLDAAWAHPPPG